MRILLDENIPVQLKPLLVGHAVKSINDIDLGWKTIKNGKLLGSSANRVPKDRLTGTGLNCAACSRA